MLMEQRPVDCLEESLGEQSFLPKNEVHREAERASSCSRRFNKSLPDAMFSRKGILYSVPDDEIACGESPEGLRTLYEGLEKLRGGTICSR
jgi:hypothetical protein